MDFAEKEQRFTIPGPSGDLEVKVIAPAPEGALADKGLLAVVCHPHPLHGGTMDNKVVTTLARSYRDLGVAAVCFNFRGVGASGGTFDNAIGEVDDLLAVANWAQAQWPQRQRLLAGFSFGSAVAAQGSYRLQGLLHLTLVAPPVERYAYDLEQRFTVPLCVIQGTEDELVDVPGVLRWAEGLRSPVDLLELSQASHFFHGQLVTFKQRLTEVLLARLG